MEKKALFDPGDMVVNQSGQIGMVISKETIANVRRHFKEAKRPGYYFAPGYCSHPDLLIQIPVFFEDQTFDSIRPMGIIKIEDLPEEKKTALQEYLKMDK
jgi:hypothetical protein